MGRRPLMSRLRNRLSNMNRIWNPAFDGANKSSTDKPNQPKKSTTTDIQVQPLEAAKDRASDKLRRWGSLENSSKQFTPRREIMKRGVRPSSANNQNQEIGCANREIRALRAKCPLSNLGVGGEIVRSPSCPPTAEAKEEAWRDKSRIVPPAKCLSGPKKTWMITIWCLADTRVRSLVSAKTSS